MDINRPTTLELNLAPPSKSQSQEIKPVSLESLNLKEGQTYQARVLGSADNLLNLAESTRQSLKDQANQVVLIRVQDKVVAVITEKALAQGQALQIKLNNDGSLQVLNSLLQGPAASSAGSPSTQEIQGFVKQALNQVLAAQSSLELGIETLSKAQLKQPENQSVAALLEIIQKSAPNLKTLLDPLLLNSSASALSSVGNAMKATPNSASLETLIQKLSPILNQEQITNLRAVLLNGPGEGDKQVRDVSQIISSIASQLSNQGKANESVRNVGAELAKLLAQSNTQTNQNSQSGALPSGSIDALKAGLQQSGLSTESNWNRNDAAAQQHQAHLALTKMLLDGQISLQESKVLLAQPERLNALLQSLNNTSSNSRPLNPNPEQFQQALQFIASLSSEGKSTGTTPNLKEALQLIVTALQSSEAENNTTKNGLLQNDLLKLPFNFPPATGAISQAATILADQELTTGQLLRLAAGMLNRIQFNQLNSIFQSQISSAVDGNPIQHWYTELPINTGNGQFAFFNMRLEREQRDSAAESKPEREKETVWRIVLSFDLDPLGPIYIQANLVPPSVSSTIWADKASTLRLINKETPFFRDQLSRLGLEVGDIRCQKGQPKQTKTSVDQHLVDTKA